MLPPAPPQAPAPAVALVASSRTLFVFCFISLFLLVQLSSASVLKLNDEDASSTSMTPVATSLVVHRSTSHLLRGSSFEAEKGISRRVLMISENLADAGNMITPVEGQEQQAVGMTINAWYRGNTPVAQCLNPLDPAVVFDGDTYGACLGLGSNGYQDVGGEYGGNVYAIQDNCAVDGTMAVFSSTYCSGVPAMVGVKRICIPILSTSYHFCCGTDCINGVQGK